MAEETNTEQTTTTETQETKSYSKEQYDGLKNNLVNQIGELRSELDAFNVERDERAKADADAENARLIENNQHKELLEKSQAEWQAERDELTKGIETMKAEKFNMGLDNTLVKSGITDEIQILGLKAKYSSTPDAPDFAEWLTAQKISPKGVSSGTVGTVSASATEGLSQRLESKDPKVKQQALMEKLSQDMGIG